MAITKKQKEQIMHHVGRMAFIGATILIVWALISIAKSQGF